MNKLVFATLFAAASAEDICCVACPEGQIKTFSIDKIFNMCGESCMAEKDYWKYKVFEPGMQKADSFDDKACEKQGYSVYKETDTHGVPHLISMTVDMYKKPAGGYDAQMAAITDEEWAAIDQAAEELAEEFFESWIWYVTESN